MSPRRRQETGRLPAPLLHRAPRLRRAPPPCRRDCAPARAPPGCGLQRQRRASSRSHGTPCSRTFTRGTQPAAVRPCAPRRASSAARAARPPVPRARARRTPVKPLALLADLHAPRSRGDPRGLCTGGLSTAPRRGKPRIMMVTVNYIRTSRKPPRYVDAAGRVSPMLGPNQNNSSARLRRNPFRASPHLCDLRVCAATILDELHSIEDEPRVPADRCHAPAATKLPHERTHRLPHFRLHRPPVHVGARLREHVDELLDS